MNDQEIPVSEDELHAYVDGQLPADRHSAVEAWLAAHPDDMARVSAWRAQADAIRARYASVANEPVAARFDLQRLEHLGGGRSWQLIAAAAAIIAFLAGGVVGWVAHGATANIPGAAAGAFTADAIDAYKLYVVEVRHPVEVPGEEEPHLVQWLSKRLNYQLRIPALQASGLKLVGGRLLPGPSGAAAFFMYESSSGERYTLYCARTHAAETAMRYAASGQLAATYWVDDGIIYVVSGQSNRERLQQVADNAYAELDRGVRR